MPDFDLVPTPEVQRWTGYTSGDCCIRFLREHNIRPVRIGRRLLWRTSDIQALISKLTEQSEQKPAPQASEAPRSP